jgi:hypothetical protein
LSPVFSDLCGLGVLAGDIPSFGCGSAALVFRGEPIKLNYTNDSNKALEHQS